MNDLRRKDCDPVLFARQKTIRRSLIASGISEERIHLWRLDNPLMSSDARRVMINFATRARKSFGSKSVGPKARIEMRSRIAEHDPGRMKNRLRTLANRRAGA